jgi:hypothetical protein
VKALLERGDSVDVICLAGHKLDAAAKLRVIELRRVKYRGNNLIRYAIAFLNFFIQATVIAAANSLHKWYRCVIIRSLPDVTVFSALVAKLRGTKVVLDMIDPMPELFRDRFGSQWRDSGARMLMIQERLSTAMADRVIATNELQRCRFSLGRKKDRNFESL